MVGGSPLIVPRINRRQADALRRIDQLGPMAWAQGRSRAGGSVSRMFDRMKEAGLVKGPPYYTTLLGRKAVRAFDIRARNGR